MTRFHTKNVSALNATAPPEGGAGSMATGGLSDGVGGAGACQLDRRGLGRPLRGPEDDPALAFLLRVRLGVDHDRLAGAELLPQDLLRHRVLDQALDGTAQRPGTERRVVALLREEVLGAVRQLDADVLAL